MNKSWEYCSSSPLLLFVFPKKQSGWLVWLLFGVLLISRGFTPYLNTSGRLIASGFGVASVLLLLPLLLKAQPAGESQAHSGLWNSAGLALAVCLSVFLRTANHSIDISLTPGGGWLGWGLGVFLGWCLAQLDWSHQTKPLQSTGRVGSNLNGLYLILTLVYFAFSAPAVIARWTQGNYVAIILAVSLLSAGWVLLALGNPGLLARVSHKVLLLWNLVFALSLTVTILVQRVAFPPTPESPPVVVGAPSWQQFIPLFLMLLSFPVIFLDLRLFADTLQAENPSPRQFAPGMLLGSLALVLLVFINIFTNVWGYVEPVSTPFRNQFHLPYLLITGGLTLLIWRHKPGGGTPLKIADAKISWGWFVPLGAVFLGTVLFAVRSERVLPTDTDRDSLIVMTYNIQQANDEEGERSHERQLALIQQVSPDILALQESDAARISLNNNDYVRYYAAKLGYHAYYGPTTVTGTFGTAILSKHPLQNPRAIFTFSDTDEIGTAEAEITVGGRTFNIYNVHPDGSDAAMLTFARVLLERSRDKAYVIALGDYNLRDDEQAFQLIAHVYTNAWTSVYPSKIGADGTDMSGRNRIDHIFLSPNLVAHDPVYLLPPDSATDHPVHWAELAWEE
ncbi:MAG: hypothetical protein FIB03_07085 [Anaerolineae bacterium]|nr:hypothetical protein [Anaerolineae bacterium]